MWLPQIASPKAMRFWSFVVLLLYFDSYLVAECKGLPPLPLSTSGKWIVDSTGSRVKLACLSWAAHLDSMVPEGLDKQQLSFITNMVSSNGFNCVRFTWATWMWTHQDLGSQTVTASLDSLGLSAAIQGISENNPDMATMSLLEAFAAVVEALNEANIMVILDNHVSKPQWCCDLTDGNGFWGDKWFDPQDWLSALGKVAEFSNNHSNVIGMSLRNEPRGVPLIQEKEYIWRNYMQQGADIVFQGNPKLLIIIAGLDSSTDLSFLSSNPLSFSNNGVKLVYEMHWYSWTILTHVTSDYDYFNGNVVCSLDTNRVVKNYGYLTSPAQPYTAPIFVSEFGMSMTGASPGQQRFMDCFFAYIGTQDLDWAFWDLPGSYYIRSGTPDSPESYGLLTPDWSQVQNPDFLKRLQAIQTQLPGPSSDNSVTYQALYHPHTGLCVSVSSDSSLQLTPCTSQLSKWTYNLNNNGMLQLQGSENVITASSSGSSANVASASSCAGCRWTQVGQVHFMFQTSVGGNDLCLDGSTSTLAGQPCLCVHDIECINSPTVPGTQWFEFIAA